MNFKKTVKKEGVSAAETTSQDGSRLIVKHKLSITDGLIDHNALFH